ncbi:MAG: hypothetical protein GKS00_11895 [Alphaproteobacteria bacterium]|nr:hypothetical protein [Alphaproteobacteria bacterium]
MNGPDDSEEEILANIATVVQGIEQFIAAGQNAEASALLEQLIPVIAHGISFVEEADEVGLFSGLALACARLSRLEDAQNYAGRAIIENPLDLLAHAILPPEARIVIARQLIHHQRHDIARDMLKTVGMTGQSSEGEFYLELLDFYDTQKAMARRLAPTATPDDTRPTLLNLVVWGEDNVQKCLTYALPSLLALGNIPALASESNVILDIYTAEEDRVRFEDDPVYAALSKFAEIRITMIPDSLLDHPPSEATPDPDRWCVAGAQYASAVAARHLDADLVFIDADNLYSESYLSGAKQHIDAGHSGVVAMATPAPEDAMADFLKAEPGAQPHCIDVDSTSLLSCANEHMYQPFFDAFISSDETAIERPPTTIFFRMDEGYATHSFQLQPVMISSDLLPDDFVFDFLATDARFMAEIVNGRDPEALLKVVEESDGDIAIIALADETDDAAQGFAEYPVTPKTCAAAGLELCKKESDIPYFLWAIRQRIIVDCGDLTADLPESDFDEANTVEEILDAFEAEIPETSRAIRFYSGALR